MILKDYQDRAIKKLISESIDLLRHRGKKLILKSPTGSGKTIIMAEFIKRFVQEKTLKGFYSFIWIAPRQLHLQSKDKLENYFENTRTIKCSLFDDLEDKKIDENEILFFNWESINRTNDINVYIRENEQEYYLAKILDNTREAGNSIILIIDESHFSTDTENANALKELFNPELTIEVSATPVFIDADSTVSVDINDVKEEGMIKKSIILNEDIENHIKNGKIISKLSEDTDELVVEIALSKREELKKSFKKEETNINPLLVIQLPSRIRQEHEDLKNNIIKLLDKKYQINTTNGKLGIYLAEEHENIEEISVNNNETEVLLFKQGIALGWDCPRAQILVLFREWHSEIFSIQTVGRIMRMPEPDKGHYDNEILNHSYVYTNLSNISLSDDIAKDMISIYTAKIKPEFKNIKLNSYYSLRQREKTRLSPLFIRLFLQIADKNKLKEKLNLELKSLSHHLISNWEIENINIGNAGINRDGGMVDIILEEMEQQLKFDHFVVDCLSPFHPEDRSVGRVKDAIYRFFDNKLDMQYDYKQDEIVKIVLSDQNIQKFKDVINETKEIYIAEVSKREKELKITEDWSIPEQIQYNENYHKEDYNKSIMSPFFISGTWKTEKKFIEYLENNSQKIEWWFKNGDRDAIYFAVPYEYEKETKLFYVDFIIKFKDGRIGLFDTKSGITLRDSKFKSEGLQNYIKEENKKGKKLFGGIVTNTDQTNLNGRWIYFDGKKEDLNDRDFSKWKNFDI